MGEDYLLTMAAPRKFLFIVLAKLLATQSGLPLWQEANSSPAAGPSETLPGPPRCSLEPPSSPTTQPLKVVLQVLHDASPPSYVEGSWLTLQAHVQSPSNGAMKLYVNKCVGAHSQLLNRSQRIYTLVFNWGCLSIGPKSGPWYRHDNVTLQFSVEAFLLNNDVEEDEVYIICWASIWSWTRPFEPGRKSCFYNTSSNKWQLADDEWESWVCDCCDSECSNPKKEQYKEFLEEGESYLVVTGPVKVKKLLVSWFKASCKTLKDLLVAALAFTGLALLLTSFLLALRKVLKGFPPSVPLHCWCRMPNEAREMDWVAETDTQCSSHHSAPLTSPSSLETLPPPENN